MNKIVNFEFISHLFQVLLRLILSIYLITGKPVQKTCKPVYFNGIHKGWIKIYFGFTFFGRINHHRAPNNYILHNFFYFLLLNANFQEISVTIQARTSTPRTTSTHGLLPLHGLLPPTDSIRVALFGVFK